MSGIMHRRETADFFVPRSYLRIHGAPEKCLPEFENWLMQIGNYNAARSALVKYGMACSDAIEFLKKAKASIDLMNWKLSEIQKGNNRKIKPCFYYPSPVHREKAMAVEISQMYDRIKMLANVRMGFMHEHGGIDPYNALIQQAVILYRWIYPFSKTPGAMLNRSLTNFSVNLIRDHFHRDDGFQKCDITAADYISYEPNPVPDDNWLTPDLFRNKNDSVVLEHILHSEDGVVDYSPLYRSGISRQAVDRSLASLASCIQLGRGMSLPRKAPSLRKTTYSPKRIKLPHRIKIGENHVTFLGTSQGQA